MPRSPLVCVRVSDHRFLGLAGVRPQGWVVRIMPGAEDLVAVSAPLVAVGAARGAGDGLEGKVHDSYWPSWRTQEIARDGSRDRVVGARADKALQGFDVGGIKPVQVIVGLQHAGSRG